MKRIFLSAFMSVGMVALIFPLFSGSSAASPPETYPLVCRGSETFKTEHLAAGSCLGCGDFIAPLGYVSFTFIRGTTSAKGGLRPGECSWLDRGMRADEPDRIVQKIEFVWEGVKKYDWGKDLSSPDTYVTFNVYNAGEQFQATGAERSKKPGIDVAKPGDPFPGGDKFAIAKTNFALASNGATAKASTTLGLGWDASGAINGDRAGINWGSGGGWADATSGVWPDWLEVDFKDGKTHEIDQIDVFTLQDDYKSPKDPGDPSAPSGMLFSALGLGLTAFEVQVWVGSDWFTVGSVSDSDLKYVGREFHFKAVTTNKIRVLTRAAADNGYSRITEVEAWGTK